MRNPKDNRRNRGPVRRDVRNNDIANALISESTLLPSPLEDSLSWEMKEERDVRYKKFANFVISKGALHPEAMEDSLMNILSYYTKKGYPICTWILKEVCHIVAKAVTVLEKEKSTRFVGMDKDCLRIQNLDNFLEYYIYDDYSYREYATYEDCGNYFYWNIFPYLLFEHITKDGRKIAVKEYLDEDTDVASCVKRLCDTVEVLLNAEAELNSAASAVGNDLTIVRKYYFHPDYIEDDTTYQDDINAIYGGIDEYVKDSCSTDTAIQKLLNSTLKGYNCKSTEVVFESQKFKRANYFFVLPSRTYTLFEIDGILVYIPRKFEDIDFKEMPRLEEAILNLNSEISKINKDKSVEFCIR